MASQTYHLSELTKNGQRPVTVGDDRLGFHIQHLTTGKSAGVQLLTLTCGSKSMEIVPTRGMGIWQATNGPIRFGWDSPIKHPVHPMWVPISEPSGLGWLAGFGELLARCGLSSNGAPEFDINGQLKYPLHGRIANLPAEEVIVELDEIENRISVTGRVLENRFNFYCSQLETRITLALDSDEIEIVDRVQNLSDRPGSIQMLYHCNFGTPVLEKGATFFAPVKRIAPRNEHAASGIDRWDSFAGPTENFCEEVYFLELAANDRHTVPTLLTNADRTLGATVRYSDEQLPCFSLWKNTVGLADGYVAGLEPATNFPNPRGFEEQHQRVVELLPNQSVEMRLAIGMLTKPDQVQRAIEHIRELAPRNPEIVREPIADWSEPPKRS